MKNKVMLTFTSASAAVMLLVGAASQASASDSLSFFSDNQTYVVSGTQSDTTSFGNENFYSKGAMMISANVADPAANYSARTMDSLFSFDTGANVTGKAGTYAPATGSDSLGTNISAAFNTEYGTGNWHISSISVALASNYTQQGIQPNNSAFNQVASGAFSLEVLSSNPNLSSVTYNSLMQSGLPATATSAGTFQWNATGPGTNNTGAEPQTTYDLTLNAALISAVESGEFTLLGVAADNQVGYVFNTSNRLAPEITITADAGAAATPTPIPAAAYLLGSGLFGLVGVKRRQDRTAC